MNIVITGANRGIGLGLVKHFINGENYIIACTRQINNSHELCEIRDNNLNKIKVMTFDLTKDVSINAFCKHINLSSIDILINNAGILENTSKEFESLDIPSIMKSFEVNTLGPIKLTKLLLKQLLNSKNGKIVHITSKMGSIEDNLSGGYYGYRISKTALNMFCKSFSIDYPNLTSVVLHPGWVKTDMGGSNATTTIDESVLGITNFIFKMDGNSSGKFFDFRGNKIPW
ncbi:MAG: hypothetical protein CBD16_01830 [Betaproteobacteria bacterium TMED156]|nr:MAG: hypothetical protein CBD16_01830 [Betaproteobacteria bacterium TMED156]